MPKMPKLSKDELQKAVQAGIDGFLDKQFSRFGRWSFYSLMAIAFAYIIHLVFYLNGWKLPWDK
jgi:hypothetical protein